MATHAEIRDKLIAALDAKAAGGLVESYTLPNGLQVRTATTKELIDAIKEESRLAKFETRSAFGLADLRGRA